MRRAYFVLGWALVLFGAVHMFATTRLFPDVSARALWFFSGGIAMSLTGALNLLNHAYGSSASGVRWVCVAANVMMTIFGIVSGIVTRASVAALVLVIGLEGCVTALSLLRPRARYNSRS